MEKIKEKNRMLAIAYYYTTHDEDEKDAVVFVVDKTKNLEKQFQKYSKMAWGYMVYLKDIIGIYECVKEQDCNGNDYKIIVK